MAIAINVMCGDIDAMQSENMKRIVLLVVWMVLGAGIVRAGILPDSTGAKPAPDDSLKTQTGKGGRDQFIDKDGDGIADGRAAGLGLKRKGWQVRKGAEATTPSGKGRYRGGRK